MVNKMFKTLLLLMTLVISQSLYAEKSSGWKIPVLRLLPAPLEQLKIKVTTKAEVEKILGKPALIEGSKYYYAQGGFKYSLEITFEKTVVKEFHYTFLTPRPPVNPTELNISVDKLTPFPGSGGAAGKYQKYSDADGELVLDPVGKTLYSVRIK